MIESANTSSLERQTLNSEESFVILLWPVGRFSQRDIFESLNVDGEYLKGGIFESLDAAEKVSEELGRVTGFSKGVFKLVQVH